MHVVIADDHPLYRNALIGLLRQLEEGVIIDEAASFTELQSLIDQNNTEYDVVLLDLDMPNGDPYTFISSIHSEQPSLPLVVISGSESPEDTRKAIQQGAIGFIPKSLDSKGLLAALRHILAGGVSVIPAATKTISNNIESQSLNISYKDCAPKLTKRQKEVFELLCEGDANKVIAKKLDLTEGTVKLHVRAILNAFGASNRTQAVSMAKKTNHI